MVTIAYRYISEVFEQSSWYFHWLIFINALYFLSISFYTFKRGTAMNLKITNIICVHWFISKNWLTKWLTSSCFHISMLVLYTMSRSVQNLNNSLTKGVTRPLGVLCLPVNILQVDQFHLHDQISFKAYIYVAKMKITV